jgi:hypothetical protein
VRNISLALFCAVPIALAVYPMLGQSDIGTLRVAISDKASGKVVPAIVCITSKADNTWRVPPDGTIVSPHPVTSKEQIAGWAAGPGTKEWSPGDPGPVRLTANVPVPGIPTEQRQDVYKVYAGLPAMPYWNEPVAYFVAKPFTIALPPGKWRLAVSRGVECLPVFEEFTIAPQQKVEKDIRLTRWVDMRQQGWYSGDPEFHNWRDKQWRNEFILAWAEAADVHMISVPSFSKTPTEIGHPQMGYGKDFRYQKGDYALASAHEGPRTAESEQGHLMELNITAVVRDTSRDHLMDMVCDAVHKQGGLCGYNHLAWLSIYNRLHPEQEIHPTWDASINTIRGKIDFFEILQFRQLGVEDYHDFLNMGVKLAALAGSDVTGGEMLGESLTYAYTDHNFSPDTWYAAVKQGHTFVTNGPMLTLTVGGRMPGDEVRVRKNANVRVRARAWAPEVIGAPRVLEVVSHGRVIRKVESHDPKKSELTADFELPPSESQWIVARTTSFNAAVAHTSPVYVIVDGASLADRAQLPQLVENWLKVLDFVEKRLSDPQYTRRRGYSASELPLLLESIQDARAKYKAVLAAGGVPVTAYR